MTNRVIIHYLCLRACRCWSKFPNPVLLVSMVHRYGCSFKVIKRLMLYDDGYSVCLNPSYISVDAEFLTDYKVASLVKIRSRNFAQSAYTFSIQR